MNIESHYIYPLLAALLVGACGETKPIAIEKVEDGKVARPTLTSTAPTAPAASGQSASAAVGGTESNVEASASSTANTPNEAVAEHALDEAALPLFEPELDGVDGLSVRRLVTTTAIERREPVAASSVFGHHDEKVYAFVELSNESDEDKSLLVHFIGPEGEVTGGITLRIPAQAPRWRTWAYTKHADEPGLWRVEIRTPDGTLIAALPFEVESDC